VSVDGAVIELSALDALRLAAGAELALLAGTAWLAQFERTVP